MILELYKEVLKIKKIPLMLFVVIILQTTMAIAYGFLPKLYSDAMGTQDKKVIFKIIILAAIIIVFKPYEKYLRKKLEFLAYKVINKKYLRKIVRMDYSTYVDLSTDKIQTIFNDISKEINVVVYSLIGLADVLDTITTLAMIFYIDKVVGLISISFMIFNTVTIRVTSKISAPIQNTKEDLKFERNAELEKLVRGFAEIRSFSTEDEHQKHNEEFEDKFFKILLKDQTYKTIGLMIPFFMVDILLPASIIFYNFLTKAFSPEVGMGLLMYSWILPSKVDNIIDKVEVLLDNIPSYRKYKEFMDIKEKITDGNLKLKSFNNDITFKNVSFSYNDSDEVLQDINLTIKKGMKLGICGASGEGKSTLIKLIPRFYDVSSGQITIDNIDIRDLTLKSLRTKIGIVHQKGYIFKGTLLANIKYGRENASEVEIDEAIKKAGIYSFINKLPNKLATEVGPGALELSGGQAQRICLARVFLQDPDIIILDEATSALDNESERIIKRSMELFSDKTIITIAHRLTTIQNCDEIVVISNHTIAERGTHSDLINLNGIYKNLLSASEKDL